LSNPQKVSLKGNQRLLHADVKAYREDPQLPEAEYQAFETADKGRGRHEVRRYSISSEIEWLKVRKDWMGL